MGVLRKQPQRESRGRYPEHRMCPSRESWDDSRQNALTPSAANNAFPALFADEFADFFLHVQIAERFHRDRRDGAAAEHTGGKHYVFTR